MYGMDVLLHAALSEIFFTLSCLGVGEEFMFP